MGSGKGQFSGEGSGGEVLSNGWEAFIRRKKIRLHEKKGICELKNEESLEFWGNFKKKTLEIARNLKKVTVSWLFTLTELSLNFSF